MWRNKRNTERSDVTLVENKSHDPPLHARFSPSLREFHMQIRRDLGDLLCDRVVNRDTIAHLFSTRVLLL